MKRADLVKEFREMSEEGLREKVADLEQELMNLRFRHASGQLEQSSQLRNISKNIARVKTFLREKAQQSQEA